MTEKAAATVSGTGPFVGRIIVHEHDDIEAALARHGYTADDRVIVIVLIAPDPNRFPERKPALAADNVISLSEVSRTRKARMHP